MQEALGDLRLGQMYLGSCAGAARVREVKQP